MRLLIVEDQQKHLEDAMATILRLQKAFELQARYASTLEAAMEQLDWAEVVVTDLFFPEQTGEPPEPLRVNMYDGPAFAEAHMSGVKLAKRCLELKKPFAICTSTCHHGTKTQPACEWIRKRHMELVDGDPTDESGNFAVDGEAAQKQWTLAFLIVIGAFEKTVRGIRQVDDKWSWDRDFRAIRGFLGRRKRRDDEGATACMKNADQTVAEVLRLYDSIPKDE